MSLKYNAPIGIEGISQVAFSSETSKYTAVIGTTGGRVRVYTLDEDGIEETYKKKWHQSIYRLKISPNNDEIITTSGVGGLKVHDFETFAQKFYDSDSHDANPITAFSVLDQNKIVTGDVDGTVRMFDRRNKEALVGEIGVEPDEEGNLDLENDLYTINDMTHRFDNHETILSARDDGALVVHDFRTKKHLMTSDTIGYSARTIEIICDGEKVLVGTDEGVISVFTWNQFGNICDRFPARLERSDKSFLKNSGSGWPSVEDISRVTENIIAVATDDGVISTLSVLPNRYLSVIGYHASGDNCGGGDCLNIDTSGDSKYLISGNPLSSDFMLHPLEESLKKSKSEAKKLLLPLSKREGSMKKMTRASKSSNARQVLHLKNAYGNFISGLKTTNEEEGSDDMSSCDDDEDSE